jgi:hypothetical protein
MPADFVVAGDTCSGLVLSFGASCTIAVLDIPLAAGTANGEPRDLRFRRSAARSSSSSRAGVPAAGGSPRSRSRTARQSVHRASAARGSRPAPSSRCAGDHGIQSKRLAPANRRPGRLVLDRKSWSSTTIGSVPRQLVVTAAPGGATFNTQTRFVRGPAGGRSNRRAPSAIEFLAPDLQLILTRRR